MNYFGKTFKGTLWGSGNQNELKNDKNDGKGNKNDDKNDPTVSRATNLINGNF